MQPKPLMLSLSQQLHSWLILPIQSFHIAAETWLGSAWALTFEMKAAFSKMAFLEVSFLLLLLEKPLFVFEMYSFPWKFKWSLQPKHNMESPANDTLQTPSWTSISLCWHAILRSVVPISNGHFDRRCAFHIKFYLGGWSLAWENCGCLLIKWIFIDPLIKWVFIKYYSQGRSRSANDEIGIGSSPMVCHHNINCEW